MTMILGRIGLIDICFSPVLGEMEPLQTGRASTTTVVMTDVGLMTRILCHDHSMAEASLGRPVLNAYLEHLRGRHWSHWSTCLHVQLSALDSGAYLGRIMLYLRAIL